ncbi:MAG: AAA family ATPase [Prochlorothrix sp.]
MKLVSLELQGFRGLADQTLNLKPEPFWAGEQQPIVFIGGNGSGKSSILEAISVLLSCVTDRLENPKKNRQSLQSLDISNQNNQTTVSLTASSDHPWLPASQSPFQWQLALTRAGINLKAKSDYDQLNRWLTQYREQFEQNPNLSFPVLVLYPVHRSFSRIEKHSKGQASLRQLETYKNALTGQKPGFSDFFQWFRCREDLENQQRLYDNPHYQDPQLTAVRHACETLLDGFSQLRVQREYDPPRMTIQKHQQTLEVTQLSDGEKNLLTLAGDLARRLAIANPALKEPLQGRGVVLIDEIELHLHPQWQSKVIEKLCRTFPNCQFILTTHSPQVITNLESVYLLVPSPQGTICEQVRTYGKDSNRILETIMDTPERSRQMKTQFDRLFRLIEEGQLTEARQLRLDLLQNLQDDAPELVRADWVIKRREVLGR